MARPSVLDDCIERISKGLQLYPLRVICLRLATICLLPVSRCIPEREGVGSCSDGCCEHGCFAEHLVVLFMIIQLGQKVAFYSALFDQYPSFQSDEHF